MVCALERCALSIFDKEREGGDKRMLSNLFLVTRGSLCGLHSHHGDSREGTDFQEREWECSEEAPFTGKQIALTNFTPDKALSSVDRFWGEVLIKLFTQEIRQEGKYIQCRLI